MEECVSKGLVKAIGLSNFTITKTENLLKTAKIVPAVNQVECHPYNQQQKLKEYCDSKGQEKAYRNYNNTNFFLLPFLYAGITFEAYSPLGNPTRPSIQSTDPIVLEDPVIKEIAEKYKATSAQVWMKHCCSIKPGF